VKVSIITPSYRAAKWLPLCIASVYDQAGVEKEHIVQDSCSDDGTGDWLATDSRVRAYIEKDTGMYDAVNRGLRRAGGDVLAYLNADEQYLPGALKAVRDAFIADPELDVLFSGTVVVDNGGAFICCRKGLVPSRLHVRVAHLPILTCSIFFRRTALESHSLFFDTAYRDIADAYWVLSALRRGLRIRVMDRLTSAFTDTGENMNLQPNARAEIRRLRESAPRWAQTLSPVLVLEHRLRKWLSGGYSQKPFSYEIYTLADTSRRLVFRVSNPTCVWRSRLGLKI